MNVISSLTVLLTLTVGRLAWAGHRGGRVGVETLTSPGGVPTRMSSAGICSCLVLVPVPVGVVV